jgi:quercetin dioxygenase-like cupin family protein
MVLPALLGSVAGVRGGRGLAVVESTLAAGAMTPLHAHDEEEGLEAVDGRITVFLGDEVIELEAGDSVVVPCGVPHTLRAGPAPTRLLSASFVSSAGRYEDFLRAVAPARPGEPVEPSAEEAAALAAVAAACGTAVLGPPGLLPAALDERRVA